MAANERLSVRAMETIEIRRSPFAFGLVLILCLGVACASQAQSGEPPEPATLSLQDAVSLALQTNRRIQVAALEVRKFQEQVSSARTQFFPSFNSDLLASHLLAPISFRFPQGAFGTFPSTGPVPSQNTEIKTPARFNVFLFVQAAQPLSQLYKIDLGVRLRQLENDIKRQQLRREHQEVVDQVKQLYYQILGTQSALDANEASGQALRELERYVRQQLTQEAVLNVNRLEVETRLVQQEYSQVVLRDALASQKEHLNHLLGRRLETEFRVEPVDQLADSEFDLAAAHSQALRQRPEVRMAELGFRESEVDLRLKKADYIPDVSFAVNYLSPFLVEVVPHNIATAGFQLSWEPFDWGRRRHEIRAKELAVEQQKQLVEDTRSQVLADVNDRLRKLREARSLLAVARVTQETAQERLRVSTNGFEQQVVLLKDVLQHQSSLAEADDQLQKALLAFWSAKADFEKAIGEEQ